MRDRPREQEVERRTAAFRDHGVKELGKGLPADEQRQRLVLVRRPRSQDHRENHRHRRARPNGAGPEPARRKIARRGARQTGCAGGDVDHFSGLVSEAIRADTTGSVLSFTVPTYEYKCPNGHVFEIFKRIADPQPEKCEICGASPVETVLYPVPVHFRGSGFYSTDYGRGGRKRDRAKESSSESGSDSGSGDKKDKPTEKKAAEAG